MEGRVIATCQRAMPLGTFRLRNKHTDPRSSQVNCTNKTMFCILEVAFLGELPVSLLTNKLHLPAITVYSLLLFPRICCVKMQGRWHNQNSDQPSQPLQSPELTSLQINPVTPGLTSKKNFSSPSGNNPVTKKKKKSFHASSSILQYSHPELC